MMLTLAWLIPLLPLTAFAIIIFFGYRLKEISAWISIAALLIPAAMSGVILFEVINGAHLDVTLPWLTIGNTSIEMGYAVDGLTAMMLVVVTWIGSMIQIYSVGYMKGEARFHRFFAYLSLFCASMLGLVLANNLILLFVCWELVGVCSYLLISFYFEKPEAAAAGKKAFLTTKIGDLGFFMGIALLFTSTGTFMFHHIFHQLEVGHLAPGLAGLGALLLFGGAMGKSAQFPLHVWLPDAMEGPTPVSALIHAATMVAAGVYMVARLFPLFEAGGGFALTFVSIVGVITILLAASIALVMNDIKKVIAYSTISQLGFMMLSLGTGGLTAGVFHLMTHAFFKALLFLGAGSVIHAAHTQNIWEMGGLRHKMPITFITFLAGSLALVGIPPFAGFWSKDEILVSVAHASPILLWLALLGVVMTSVYSFRLLFVVFGGEPRKESHAHESPLVMTVPLIVLAIFATFIGFVGAPFWGNPFEHFIHLGHPAHHDMAQAHIVMLLGIAAGLLGLLISYAIYSAKWISREAITKPLQPIIVFLQNKYGMDDVYQNTVVRGSLAAAGGLFVIDQKLIDAFVNLVGRAALLLAELNRWWDSVIVDGAVNGSAVVVDKSGRILKKLQTGFAQHYLMVILIGVIVLFLTRPGPLGSL